MVVNANMFFQFPNMFMNRKVQVYRKLQVGWGNGADHLPRVKMLTSQKFFGVGESEVTILHPKTSIERNDPPNYCLLIDIQILWMTWLMMSVGVNIYKIWPLTGFQVTPTVWISPNFFTSLLLLLIFRENCTLFFFVLLYWPVMVKKKNISLLGIFPIYKHVTQIFKESQEIRTFPCRQSAAATALATWLK